MAPQRTPRDRKKPETYTAEPASGPNANTCEGRGRGRGRARAKGRGRSRGKVRAVSLDPSRSPSDDKTEALGASPALPEVAVFIGRRLTVHWQMEEEDFEGYVKQFCPGLRYPYEVAYDDGDEEWGWFSTTQFHTDEVSRKYSWLTDQDEAVAKALLQLEAPTAPPTDSAKPEPASAPAAATSSTVLAMVASIAPTNTGTVGSIALKKDQLRAARDVLSHKASGQAVSGSSINQSASAKGGSSSIPAAMAETVLSGTLTGSAVQPAQSAPPSLPDNRAHEAPEMQLADKPAQSPKANVAVKEASALSRVSAAAAAKLQLNAGARSPCRKRKSDQLASTSASPEASLASAASLPTDGAQSRSDKLLAESTGKQSDLTTVADNEMAQTAVQQQQARYSSSEKTAKQKAAAEKRVKHANDPQLNADVKENKRRRLRKMSEKDAPDLQTEPADELQDKAGSVGMARNGKLGSPIEADSTVQAHQERRESNAQATTSATAGPAGVRPSQRKPAGQDRQRKQPSDNANADAQPQRVDNGAAGDVRPADKHLSMVGQSAAGPAHKLIKAGTASIAHDSTEAAPSAGGGSKPGVQQHGNATAASAPFALPGSAPTPSASSWPLVQTTSIPGGVSGSTRISLPPKLTQLASLRSKPPAQELKADSSPIDIDTELEEAAAAAAAAAAVEAHLKGVTQQFDAMLHNTLQRTKESVHKVTQFAVRAAAGKHGKTAAHRLVIMILDLIETAQMSKRVDLFYLLDSLLQVSLRESKEGSEAKVEASKTFSRVIAAGLNRIAGAMAKDSECITKASKVLDLWQRRQILAKSVLKPALDLLGKMKGEHEAAAAAAAMAANKLGQPLVPRRPLRLLMPYALLDSDTGLPTHTICYPLDQWGSLAGFRFPGEDGQVTEFELRPSWRLPLQEAPEDWDVNPATEDLPIDQVLAAAADVRREHLAVLEEQKEARARREASPWADRLQPHDDYTAVSPTSIYHGDDAMDGEDGASPAEGETGYYETAQDSAFQFEPPRAPAHYGASRNSPEDFHRAGSSNPWRVPAGAGVPWGAGTYGSTWGHMPHTTLHSQPSLYDPMSQSLGRAHPRLQELAEDQLYAAGQSQSPESSRWFNVPFDGAAQLAQPAATAGTSSGVQYQHRRATAEQPVQPQVAVRDSNVDFDMDTGFSDDDDAPPPLPAEPPPGPEAPPLPSEDPLPPLPPEEDRPPLPQDDPSAPPLPEGQPGEARLAAAGLFEPFTQPAASQPGFPLPPLPPAGFVYGLS